MIHMKPATKNIISTLESNLNGLMKEQLYQAILREEVDCVLIKFPYKRDENGTPTWTDLEVTIYQSGQFKKDFKEANDKD